MSALRVQSLVTADRKTAYRERMKASGMVQFCAWVPRNALADFTIAADRTRANPDLTIALLRDAKTGRVRKL